MAVDKLVDSTQLDADLTSVANAIRAKSGGSNQLAFPSGFVSEIGSIPSGGGITAVDVFKCTEPSGRVETWETFSTKSYCLYNRPLTELFAPNVTIYASSCAGCTNLRVAVVRDFASTNNFSGCTKLESLDIVTGSITGGCCSGATNLTTIILRKTTGVASLNNINGISNTPFASGEAGGTLYVPSSLVSEYKQATNWSTILGYANNSIQAIEGSIYETQYADGTPIS